MSLLLQDKRARGLLEQPCFQDGESFRQAALALLAYATPAEEAAMTGKQLVVVWQVPLSRRWYVVQKQSAVQLKTVFLCIHQRQPRLSSVGNTSLSFSGHSAISMRTCCPQTVMAWSVTLHLIKQYACILPLCRDFPEAVHILKHDRHCCKLLLTFRLLIQCLIKIRHSSACHQSTCM